MSVTDQQTGDKRIVSRKHDIGTNCQDPPVPVVNDVNRGYQFISLYEMRSAFGPTDCHCATVGSYLRSSLINGILRSVFF